MKSKRPSIKDIAANLNVSVTTVSFVLNGKGPEMRISEEVTRKILEYAKAINYTPNQLAQSLRTGRTNVIVFMVEDISNPFFARLARIIEVTAYQKGYKVIFCSNENDDQHTEELLQVFRDQKVTGYIIIPSAGAKKQISALLEENVPVILFDRYFPDLETNYVVIDNENATYNATNHLIKNGFRHVGFVTIAVKQTQMMDRLKGYTKAVKEAKLQRRVLELPFVGAAEGEKLMRTFFEANPQLDAVFFATNYLTQRGLLVMREHFPGKLLEWGIMTFDDNEFFRIHTPSISAVAQPLDAIGNKLMEMMLELLKNNEKKAFHQVVLKAELRERESSKAKVARSLDQAHPQ